MQSRYYDPEVCRFINADEASTGQGFRGLNIFAYCGNNPVMGYDPYGNIDWQGIKAWFEQVGETISEYLTDSNIYGSVVGGLGISNGVGTESIKSAIRQASKPANVGAGTFAKQCSDELAQISRFNSAASKVLKVASYGAAVIDVIQGISQNIKMVCLIKK